MYDAREDATGDQQTANSSAYRQGIINNEIKWIRAIQAILGAPVSAPQELLEMTFEQLQALSLSLLEAARNRMSPDMVVDRARQKAIRDRPWILNGIHRERQRGRGVASEILVIRGLQETLAVPPTDEQELRILTIEQLQQLKHGLVQALRERMAQESLKP